MGNGECHRCVAPKKQIVISIDDVSRCARARRLERVAREGLALGASSRRSATASLRVRCEAPPEPLGRQLADARVGRRREIRTSNLGEPRRRRVLLGCAESASAYLPAVTDRSTSRVSLADPLATSRESVAASSRWARGELAVASRRTRGRLASLSLSSRCPLARASRGTSEALARAPRGLAESAPRQCV